jgi:hypothetical protein
LIQLTAGIEQVAFDSLKFQTLDQGRFVPNVFAVIVLAKVYDFAVNALPIRVVTDQDGGAFDLRRYHKVPRSRRMIIDRTPCPYSAQ